MSTSKQIFIFLGAPGSGKGSLAYACVDKLHWKQLSTGDLCRKHIVEGSVLGQEIDFAIKSGTLVSDDVIIDMVGQWLNEETLLNTSIILDGFPRTVPQAEGFIKLIKSNFAAIPLRIVHFVISDEVVIKRLSSRLICSNKDCQRSYSSNEISQFFPKNLGKCDKCGATLKSRDDDRPEAIASRLEGYHYHIGALMDFYKKSGYVVEHILGNASSEQVFEEFLKLVELQ